MTRQCFFSLGFRALPHEAVLLQAGREPLFGPEGDRLPLMMSIPRHRQETLAIHGAAQLWQVDPVLLSRMGAGLQSGQREASSGSRWLQPLNLSSPRSLDILEPPFVLLKFHSYKVARFFVHSREKKNHYHVSIHKRCICIYKYLNGSLALVVLQLCICCLLLDTEFSISFLMIHLWWMFFRNSLSVHYIPYVIHSSLGIGAYTYHILILSVI